jgi:predicted amidohydrolase YtcJ
MEHVYRGFFPRAGRAVVLAGALVFAAAAASLWAQQPADVILHNGKVLTVDKNFTITEAVAITGNKITAVGSSQAVLQKAGPNTLKIDLKGRTVIPGLIDTHLHIEGAGPYAMRPPDSELRTFSVDWRGVKNKQDALNQIRTVMQRYHPPAGDWISFGGRGGDATMNKILLDEMTATDLSSVIPDNPALFSIGIPEENGLFVNQMALDLIMKEHGDFLKKYGRFWLGSNGKPDGHLEPPATRLILNLYAPRWKADQMADGLQKRLQELNAQGHTAISTKARLNEIEAYRILEKRNEQTVRLAYGLGFDYFGSVKDPVSELKQFQNKMGTGDEMLWVSSVAPSSVDGASTRACTNLKRTTAFGALDQWWPVGQCHTDSEYKGGPARAQSVSGNYFRDFIMVMGEYGLRLANDHVAGDRSISNLLGMIEQIQKQYGVNATKNWAFDHCVLVDPKDFQRAARLGAMFSCAPKYLESLAQDVSDSYGPQVANSYMVPVKSLLAAGARVAYEADRDTYVWHDLEVYMTRKDPKGKVWGPQEKLDKATTLRMATSFAADYVLKPDLLGSVETGKWADLVVLDKDYMTIAPDELHTIEPLLTMMNGRIVFVQTGFADENNLRPTGAVISTYSELKSQRPAGGGFQMVGDSGG